MEFYIRVLEQAAALPPGDLPTSGTETPSPALVGQFYTTETHGSQIQLYFQLFINKYIEVYLFPKSLNVKSYVYLKGLIKAIGA